MQQTMTQAQETDLSTEAQVVEFAERTLFPAVAEAAKQYGAQCRPFGMVIATFNPRAGKPIDKPKPFPVAAQPTAAETLDLLRKAAVAWAADGVFYVAVGKLNALDAPGSGRDGALVLLEHKRFGTRCWVAMLKDGQPGNFGELAPAALKINDKPVLELARLLPHRYLN